MDSLDAEVAAIRMEYRRERSSDRSHIYWMAGFSGFVDAHRYVPTPVLLLALRVTAGLWATQAPQTGQWFTERFRSTGG